MQSRAEPQTPNLKHSYSALNAPRDFNEARDGPCLLNFLLQTISTFCSRYLRLQGLAQKYPEGASPVASHRETIKETWKMLCKSTDNYL